MVKDLDCTSWNSYDEEIGYNSSLEPHTHKEGNLVLQQSEENAICPCPTFGNISVSNGSNIHFGNKTFYQGPVTIKQFVVADGDKLKKISESEVSGSGVENFDVEDEGGVENPGFEEDCGNNGDGQNGEISEVVTDTSTRVGFFKALHLKKLLIFYRTYTLSICLFVVIVALTVLTLTQVWKSSGTLIVKHEDNSNNTVTTRSVADENSHNTPIDGPIDPTKIKPLVLKLVSRLEWLAQPPAQPADPLKTPVPYVIISHTATESCRSQAQCVFQVRYIQTFHMESRGWWDIGYNFLIGGDGEVYVGRGWDKEGAHTFGYNAYSIGISFVGTFIDVLPTKNQLLACKRLIEKGVELGYVRKDYKLLGARQLQTTQSPGTKLFEELKTWPHWSENP